MLRFVRQVVNEEQDFPTVIIPLSDDIIDNNHLDSNTTSFIVSFDNNNTKYVKRKISKWIIVCCFFL